MISSSSSSSSQLVKSNHNKSNRLDLRDETTATKRDRKEHTPIDNHGISTKHLSSQAKSLSDTSIQCVNTNTNVKGIKTQTVESSETQSTRAKTLGKYLNT